MLFKKSVITVTSVLISFSGLHYTVPLSWSLFSTLNGTKEAHLMIITQIIKIITISMDVIADIMKIQMELCLFASVIVQWREYLGRTVCLFAVCGASHQLEKWCMLGIGNVWAHSFYMRMRLLHVFVRLFFFYKFRLQPMCLTIILMASKRIVCFFSLTFEVLFDWFCFPLVDDSWLFLQQWQLDPKRGA